MGNRNGGNQINNGGNGGVNEQILVQPDRNMPHIEIDAPSVKKVFAVRNPIYLKKPTLSLEKDGTNPNLSYIKFNYDSIVDFNIFINFDVQKNTSKPLIPKEYSSQDPSNYILSYSPTDVFASKSIVINNLPRGENMEFFEKKAVMDTEYFKSNKQDHGEGGGGIFFDVSIEMVPIFEPGSPEYEEKNEVVFVTLCSFEYEENDRPINTLKIDLQRLKTYGMWIDIHDIFNSSTENGECIICYSALRNTIFLPCKHACSCNTCAHSLKMRNNPCPICKKPINDLLILEVDEKETDNGDNRIMGGDNNLSNINNINQIENEGNFNENENKIISENIEVKEMPQNNNIEPDDENQQIYNE